jgi:transposase-like protein
MRRTRALTVLANRSYWREDDARRIVDAWQDSGESIVAFARRLGLTRQRLSRWVTRLGRSEPGRLHFHPVRVADAAPRRSAAACIDIELVDGRRVRIAPGVAADDLRCVLAVLAEQTAC